MRAALGWSLLTLLAASLTPGCTSYDVRQSSLVPAPALPPPHAFDRRADVFVGNSTVSFLGQPERAPNEEAGLYIPRHQFDGAVGLRFSRYFSMRLTYRHGLSAGAMETHPTLLPKPDDDVWGAGLGVSARIPFEEEGLEMQLHWDNMVMSVPSRLFAVCTSFCSGGVAGEVQERDNVLLLSAGATLSWHFAPVARGWLTMALQNHPTNDASFRSTEPDAEVDMGPANGLIGLGVEVELVRGFAVIPSVQIPVANRPIRYGPILGLGLRGSFGSDVVQRKL